MFRIAAAFLATAGCYTVYAAAIVPLIEPSARPKPILTAGPLGPTSLERQREMLAQWFAPDDWEMDKPSVFETQQGMLLFKDYDTRENGFIEIRPCSMVFLSNDPQAADEDRRRRAFVLRAPQGALLRFDPPLDIGHGRGSKLVGGELLGEVLIHSGQKLPGPEDDLRIRTRDVVMTETDVMTPHRIEFTLGEHHGHGLGVHIRLDSAPGDAAGPTNLRGVQAFTVEQQVFVHLQPTDGSDVFPGQSGGGKPAPVERPAVEAAAAATIPPPPFEIRSTGPFTFDFLANTAQFRREVEVQRLHLDGTRDTMTGDQLKIFFASPGEAPPGDAVADESATAAAPAAAATPPKVKKLDPVRLEFLGEPVIVRAQQNGLQARAQFIEHDMATRELHLRDASEVIVRDRERELRAPEIFAQPAAVGRLGTFRAVGRGRFDSASAERPGETFHAQWTSHVHFRPHEDRHVLSVYGDAQVEAAPRGALTGDEIHFWLKEVPKPPQPGAAAAAAEPETELEPDRLLVLGPVQIESPQLTGAVERLEAWFEQATPVGVARRAGFRGEDEAGAKPQATNVAAPAGPDAIAPPVNIVPLPAAATPSVPPKQQFRIDGRILRLQIAVADDELQLREAIVEQNVRVVETQTTSPNEKPLVIQGDLLHLAQPQPEESFTTVTGSPAFVEAREMTITGGKLTLHRPTPDVNRMGVVGQGVLTMPVDRDLEGRPTVVRETLHLSWQGGMTFDGQVAEFSRGVEGRLSAQFLQTDRLRVTFDRPLGGNPNAAAAQPGSDSQPQITHVDCYDRVLIESRTVLPDGNLAAVDRVRARTLSLDQQTGDFTADGPDGEVTSVRVGTALKPGALGAAGQPNPAAAPLPAAAGPAPQPAINYLHVRFQKNVVGNLHRREMTFHNQVKTLYGPIPDWTKVIDPDRPKSWLPQTVFVTCDQMRVASHVDPNAGTESYELVAEGNTRTEGTNFTALAPRLTYAQAKDLLVVEGDGRTDAQLFQEQDGGRNGTSARRFMVWPSTNRVQIDGATYLELAPR
jgi:hypothetical protein